MGDDEAESANSEQETSSSGAVDSAYTTDEHDVEFEGVDFEGFGMELPEEL